ncbi:MAG: glycosyltransferase [Bdellovibrio sp.]
MKILLVSDAQSIHTKRWAEAFEAEGHIVHVASFRAASIPGITVHQLPTLGLGKLGYFLAVPKLKALFKTIAPDVVHAQYVTSYGFIAALAKIKPLVVTAWGTDILISPKQSRMIRWLASYALKHADHVTTVAEHMNSAALSLGASPEKLTAIPFGVDTNFFIPSRDRHPSAAIQIISTRNFAPVYNIETLIEALWILKTRNIKFSASLIGKGPDKERLEGMIQKYSLEKDITFKGHVAHSTLVDLLGNSDLFVTTSLSDGNNISLNEAMATGVFPIASDIPANTQWIEHGKNGFLFKVRNATELASCIESAVANPALRKSAEEYNLNLVKQKADWQSGVQKMKTIYQSIIDGNTHV